MIEFQQPLSPAVRARRSAAKRRRWIQGTRLYFLTLGLERLEARQVLHGDAADVYLPPSQFLYHDDGFLSPPAAGAPLDIALAYLDSHAAELGLARTDLNAPFVTDEYTDTSTGLTHLYLRQQVHGLEVASANLSVAVTAGGQVVSVGGGFVPGLNSRLSSDNAWMPEIDGVDAVLAAAKQLDLQLQSEPVLESQPAGIARAHLISAPELSLDPIPVRLHYVPMEDGSAVLAWQLIARTPSGENWFDLSVPATNLGLADHGNVVALYDWVEHASYNLLALPSESPQDGGFVVRTDLEDPLASPFGWHDTNGASGPEFLDTRGNNVDAHLDRDGNNAPDTVPPRPLGGALLDFSAFTFDATAAPSTLQNQNIAQVNLFTMNNVLHDVHYKYGFTEVAGNFQVNNYGRGGAAGDAVQADAQDNASFGSTNNANFATPPDGLAPRMQMFEFTSTSPRRDSDLDNGIIIHEYGHGVSNRLTGGPANSNALSATQSKGMGEGWSDWHSLMFMQRPTDTPGTGFGMGTYVLGQPLTGPGIRRQRYSFDMTIDPITFNAYGTGAGKSTEVHNTGEIWASALWDLNWLLISKLGFDANLYTGYTGTGPGGAGNKLAMRLVMDALKVQPANPSFVQARDAILAADNVLTGGSSTCEVWTAFARRGLGQAASTASSSSTIVTTSFVVPAGACGLAVTSTVPVVGSVVTATPVDYVVNFSSPVAAASVQPADFSVDGIAASSLVLNTTSQVTFQFAAAPFTTQGLHSMTLPAGAILRASDSLPLTAFAGQFRFDAVPLQVVATNPAFPGGTFLVGGPLTFDVTFNEALDPASVQASDLALSGVAGVSVSGVTLLPGNTTARFTIVGVAGEGTLTTTIAAGAVNDAFGNPSTAAFTANYGLEAGTVAFPATFAARLPLGSLIYEGNVSATIAPATDADSFTLTIDPNQTLAVQVTPATGSLQAVVEVRDSSNTIVASATASAPGRKVLAPLVPVLAGGLYTITVTSAGGTAGGYSIQATLNAAAEIENSGGAANDTLATAQNIDAAATLLGGTAARLAVMGAIGDAVQAGENFEGGALPASFSTYSSNSAGRIRVIAPGGSGNTSAFALLMDSNADGTYALNEAIYSLNLAGVVQPTLRYSYVDFSDEEDSLPLDFTGHVNGDGVAISDDGTRWRTISLNVPAGSTTWTTATIDLAAAAAAAGMTLSPNFRIKFQQYDNFAITTDGRGYDNIQVTVADPQDTYQFTLAAGDTASIAVKGQAAGTLNAQLRDSGGAVLASAAAGPVNVDKALLNFTAAAGGTYYLAVTGSAGAYSALVMKNATFEAEANDTRALAQGVLSRQVAGDQYAVGHLGVGLTTTTLRFTELPTQPINGVTHAGVSFGFTVGGAPSIDARYNSGGPVAMRYVQDPSVEGDAAGILTLDFTQPTSRLEFGVALLASGTVTSGVVVQLYDAALNLISTTPVTTQNEGFGFSEALFSMTTAGIKRAVLDFNQSAAPRFVLDNVVYYTDVDQYGVRLAAGATFAAATATPATASGQFVNTLDPRLRLLRADGTLVVSDDNGNADGRNATLAYTNVGPAADFFIEVSSASASQAIGEYALRISNNLLTPPPFLVIATTPSDASLLFAVPTTFTVDFSAPYLATSIQAADLQLDGASASGFTLIDGDTVRFNLPGPISEGLHTVTIAGGAMADLLGTPVTAFSSTFRLDSIAPRVVATSIAPGAVLLPGPLTYQVTFSEPMKASNLSSADYSLLGNVLSTTYAATTASLNAGGTILTLTYANLPEDNYTLTLVSGASGGANFTDVTGAALDGEFTGAFPSGNGSAGGDFAIGFAMEFPTEAFPALAPRLPLGSRVYDGALTRLIASPLDIDEFTLSVDPGQTLTLLLDPVAAGLLPVVELISPSAASLGSAGAAAAGQNALLQTAAVATGGVYTIRVYGQGGTTGQYSLQVALGAALEREGQLVGAANNTLATAQDFSGAFTVEQTALSSASRGAVLGVTDGGGSYAATAVTPGFQDISTTGTRSTAVGDDSTQTLSAAQLAGFTFPFFGTTYSSLSFSTNALVTFGGADASYSNGDLSTSPSVATIAAMWDDLYVENTGTGVSSRAIFWQVVGSGANQQFIVQWNNIRQLGGSTFFTLQAVLSLDGSIQINYGAGVSAVSASATVGVKAAGTSNPPRLLVSFIQPPGPLVGSNLSTRIAIAQTTPDYYAFALAAGETAALAVTGQAAGSLNLELRSAADAVLATGSAGATNVTSAINAFTAPIAGTYYARIAGGSNVPYSLVVTKNATCDLEANDTFVTAQSLAGSGAALGAITTANVDWYSINVTGGARLRLESSTPADGGGQFANALNPRLELYDPANNLIVSGAALADGRNESLAASGLAAGLYKVRVSGEGGTTGEYLLTSELSAAPVISALTATSPLVEGGSTDVNGAFTSPDSGPHTVVIQWGLGQGSTTLNLAASVLTFSATHPYPDNSPVGGYTISVTVASSGGTSAPATDIATVINAAPTIASIASPPTIFENDTHTITGVYRDLGTLDTHAIVIAWGPGEGTTTLTTAGPNPAGSTLIALGSGEWQFTASHQYRDDNPTATALDVYPISISVADDDGGSIGRSAAVTVRNVAPSVIGLAATSIVENETTTLTGTIGDAGTLDTFTVFIDWGNGSETIAGVSAGTFNYTRRFLNDSLMGNFPIAVTVTDDDGSAAAANTSVAVANIVPAITTLTAPGTIDENGTFAIAGEFNDPGTLDAHAIVITWGAGEATTTISTALPPPAGATLVSLGNGNWRFSASHQYLDDNPTGTAYDLFSIGVTVADEVGGTSSSTSVTVNNVPPTPSIVGASDPKLEGNTITVNGSAADVGSLDLVAYAWQVYKVGFPAPFAAGGNSTTFSFTPDNDGDYRVELTATDDDGGARTVSQTIAVANVAPVASNLAVVTGEDQGVGVPLLATDVPGDTLSFTIDSGPLHGALTGTAPNLTYLPAADYHGPDSFTYRASDGALAGSLATVVLTVTPINDVPLAASDAYNTAEDAPLVVAAPGVLGGDSDVDNDPLTAAILSGPVHGTLTLNVDGSFHYAPALNYHGADSFTYQASDALEVSAAATVSLTVTPVNDPPVATGDSYTTAEDAPLSSAAPGVLTSDSDVDGDALTAILVDGPAHGTLVLDSTGGFNYVLAANYHGPDSFTYRASDGSLNSNVATVSLSVTPVNDAPSAASDLFTATEDVALSVAAPGVLGGDADIDGDSLAAAVAVGPAHGTLNLRPDGSFTYTPDANFNGSDSFTYLASDAAVSSNVATVTLSVTPVNDAPTAVADQISGPENAPLIVGSPGLLANDTDVDVGDTRTVVAINGQTAAVGTTITLASGALLTVQSDGSYAYDPNGRFALLVVGQSARDGFSYAFVDSAGAAATATVTIDVLGVTIPNTIAGSVYADVNNSGQRDAPELGLPTVLVVLEGPIVRLTRTDIAGNYRFDGLPRGNYTVWEYHPQSFLDGIDTRGEPSLGTVANDRFEAVSLTSGVVASGYNFGERGLLNPSKALSLASTATTFEIMMAVLAEDEPAGLEAQIAPTLRATAPPIPVWPGRLDVSQDGFVSPLDAILIINALNARPAAGAEGESASLLAAAASDSRLDTNADGSVSPIDAILVINYLNSHPAAAATAAAGESDGQLAEAAVDSQAEGVVQCEASAALLDSLLTLLADDLCQPAARARRTVAS